MRAAEQHAHDRKEGTQGLIFPIKLRCASAADLLSEPGLEAGLARALGRAFARARSALPAETAVGDGIALRPPHLTSGNATGTQATELLALVQRAIETAARAQSLPRAGVTGRTGPPASDLPRQLAERFDPDRYDPRTGGYNVPSYQRGGNVKVPAKGTADPFAPLVQESDANVASLKALRQSLDQLKQSNAARDAKKKAVDDYIIYSEKYAHAARAISQVEAGTLKKEDVPNELHKSYNVIVGQVFENYRRFRPEWLKKQVEILQNATFDHNVIRAAVRKLDAEADELKLPDEEVLHGTLIDLGNIFIGLLFVTQPETLRRLAFLTVFYASPLRVRGYALARLVATNLPGEWWERLAKIHQTLEPYFEVGITFPRTIDEPYGRVTTQPGAPLSARAQKAAHALPWATGLRYAVDRAQWLRREGARLGDLPSQLSEAHNPPTDEFVIEFASRVTQLQVEIPVLELWAAVILLKQFFEVEHFDYSEFTPRFAELEKALITELAKVDHEGVGDRFKGWIKDQKDLQDDMVSSARKQAIKREVIGAIPALMLAPFAAEAAGAWIAEAVSTARWVIILGRAAAVTAVMQLVGPSGGVGGRPTVTGVLEQFGINLLSEGLGSLLRKFADIAETSNGIRRVMFKVLSARPTAFVVSTATVTAAQVAVAKLEAKVRGQGGETDITALLTLNAILNGLGFILGAAVRWPRKAARGETGDRGGVGRIQPVRGDRPRRNDRRKADQAQTHQLARRLAAAGRPGGGGHADARAVRGKQGRDAAPLGRSQRASARDRRGPRDEIHHGRCPGLAG